MAWGNIVDVITGGLIKAVDFNQLMENIRVLGGNGTSAPSSDIETLFTNSVSFTSQAGIPSSTPSALGQFNLDTTGNRLYVSTGTSSSADWDRVGVSAYGTQTVTGGGGDVIVNLDWDWSGGILIVFTTDTSSEYMQDTNTHYCTFITTYDALTGGGYSTDHILGLIFGSVASRDKSGNDMGQPKSATSTSFTLDDDGSNTGYCKWMVIA